MHSFSAKIDPPSLEDLINPHEADLCEALCESILADVRIINQKITLLTSMMQSRSPLHED